MFQTKKAGLLTKIIVFILLGYAIYSLINLRHQISVAQNEVATLQQRVISQSQRNAELAESIENSGDLEHWKDIAREKLDLLEPGEKIFYISD